MPKEDKRQIHLDPMEWRDAMKDVIAGKGAKQAPAKKAPKKKKAPAKKGR